MIDVLIGLGICIVSYFLGCFSTARVLARHFKNLNIYKVGTRLADTHNIYHHISKPLGILATIMDIAKMVFYIILLKFLFGMFSFPNLSSNTMLFVYGIMMIAGHCLPVTHKFIGGRGINPYIGLMLIFIPYIMPFIFLLALLIGFIFKQVRFAQYLVVLLPPIVCLFLPAEEITKSQNTLMVVAALLMGIFNYIVSKRLGEI